MGDTEEYTNGIYVDSFSSSKNFHGRNAYLNMNFNIRINEPFDIAQVDASELEDRITAAINDIVADYASDGQEIDE